METHKVQFGILNTLQKKPPEGLNNKPPILLVHGAWHGAWCWEDTYLDYFSEVGHETWAMDLRGHGGSCLLYTSPSPRDLSTSRMPSSA